MIYHSALKNKKILDLESINGEFKDRKGNICLTHDLKNGINQVFNNCDCIYSEPAWKSGFDEFNKRAKSSDQISFEDYNNNIKSIIQKLNKPSALIISKTLIDFYNPHDIIQTKIHNYKCVCVVWNFNLYEKEYKNNFEIINEMSLRFNCVLDFCCGYGNSGKIFLENNKNFICSDFNGKCINYIKENILIK